MSTWAIVLACGKEQEIGQGVDVAFLTLGSRPVLSRSLQTLEQNPDVDGVVLVVRKERIETAIQVIRFFGCRKIMAVVAGGSIRLRNLKDAYERVPSQATAIMVHDSARPFISSETVSETIKAGRRYGAAVAAVPCPDAVKLAEKGKKVTRTLDRKTVWQVQTPQVFKRDCFEKILKSSIRLKDDESALLEKSRQPVHLVPAGKNNIKIRTADDLAFASALLSVARGNTL